MKELIPAARLILAIVLCLWAGMVIGVSLIATPVKFQAPSLTMQTGLEIGRYTFRVFSVIELCLLALSVAGAFLARPPRFTIAAITIAGLLVLLQRYWLLPALDARVSQVLAGGSPDFSMQHTLYAAMEVAKVALLITGAAAEYRLIAR